MARMKAKLKSKEEEGVTTSQPTVVKDMQKMLDEVLSKVVEEAEVQGSCQATRTEAEHDGNVKEDMSSSARAQVLFHVCNIIKYLMNI